MHQYVTFIGGFPIRFYGIFFSLGIIFGCVMAYYLLKKDGRGWHEIMFDLGLTIAFIGIIGGRLWDVFFFDWGYYHNHLLEIPYVWQGGMAIQGGVIFAAPLPIYSSGNTIFRPSSLRTSWRRPSSSARPSDGLRIS